MGAKNATEETKVERTSDRELVVTRTFNGPVHLVYKAWTTSDLLMKWWAPESFGVTFISCETDLRIGGEVRFVFKHPATGQPMAFFGKYLDVKPNARLVWTNEETPDGSITTVTFADKGGKTEVVVHDLYPSKEVLDAAVASGSTSGAPVQFEQLDALLAASI